MKQKGFVLFVVMIFLIIMSMLGITMFGGFIKDQKMAGNMREKQRAIDAAEASLNRVQFWMQQPGNVYTGDWVTGVACTSVTQTGTAPVVCSNVLANPASLPWASANTFNSSRITVDAAGARNAYAGSVNYYIQYMGTTTDTPPTGGYYRVTSTAQGGNATAAAVLEGLFKVTATARDIGGG